MNAPTALAADLVWLRNPNGAVSHAFVKGPGSGDAALCGQILDPDGGPYGFENDTLCSRCQRIVPGFRTSARLAAMPAQDRVLLAFIGNAAGRLSSGVCRSELAACGLSWRRAERLLDSTRLVWTTEDVVSTDGMPERVGVVYHTDAVVSDVLQATYVEWVNRRF